jgi:predicted RNA binding protein YcfA (HicA-like mRNA interferase family)
MPKLPVVKPRELIKVLRKLGFSELRQKGSHKFFYRQEDGKATVVPFHSKDISRGLLRKILNEIGLSPGEFKKLLKK